MPLAFLTTWAHADTYSPACWSPLPGTFLLSCFPAPLSQPVALLGITVTQEQDLALDLGEPHTVGFSPTIQGLPAFQKINTPTVLDVDCEITEGALDPLIQLINKDVKQS